MARTAKTPAAPVIRTSTGTPGHVRLGIGFPHIIGDPSADPDEQFVRVELTDDASGRIIAELTLRGAQFASLLAGSPVTVEASTLLPGDRSQYGKRSQNTSVSVSHTDLPLGDVAQRGYEAAIDALAEQRAAAFLADGWETASVRKTHTGRTIVARRYVDEEGAPVADADRAAREVVAAAIAHREALRSGQGPSGQQALITAVDAYTLITGK